MSEEMDIIALTLAKKYTDESLDGAGALKGVPCQIQSKTSIDGGTRITFLWEDNNGTEHTTLMDVMNGIDGTDGTDGLGIKSVAINAENNHLIVTFDDDTTADAGEVPTEKGDTGRGIESMAIDSSNHLIVTYDDDTTDDAGEVPNVQADFEENDTTADAYIKNKPTLGTASAKDYTDTVRPNSHDLVESNAVANAINQALTSVYTPRGDLSCAELTSALLIAENVGNVYEMSDSGTTSALFVQGAGIPISAGNNVGIIKASADTYMFNYMGNSFDLHDYQKKDLAQAIEGATTVEGALGALSTNKATQAEVNDIINVLGAKNLLPNNATSQTVNGVTFTVNSDGSVTVNGTASADTWFQLCDGFKLKNVEYTLTGCPSGGDATTYELQFRSTESSSSEWQMVNDYGNGRTATGDPTRTYIAFVGIHSGYTATNLTFYPMIRIASDPDNTYQPYAKTNQQLTADSVDWYSNGIIGAKNLIPFPYPKESDTVLGIDFTANSNGEVIASGTSTGIAVYDVVNTELYGWNVPREGTYILSDGLSDADYEYAYTAVTFMYNDGTIEYNVGDTSIGRTVITIPSNLKNFYVGCCIRTDKTVSNIKFKPMLRMIEDSDETFRLYAKTNRELTVEKMSYADNGVLGAKNLLPFPYESGQRSIQGLTFSFDNKNGVVVSGTNTSSSTAGYSFEYQRDISNFIGKTITISVENAPDNADAYCPFIIKNSSDEIVARYDIDSEHPSYTFTVPSTATTYDFQLYVRVGKSVNATLYPMIRLASDGDSTYQPYAMTNRELTESKAKIIYGFNSWSANTPVTITLPRLGGLLVGGRSNKGFAIYVCENGNELVVLSGGDFVTASISDLTISLTFSSVYGTSFNWKYINSETGSY